MLDLWFKLRIYHETDRSRGDSYATHDNPNVHGLQQDRIWAICDLSWQVDTPEAKYKGQKLEKSNKILVSQHFIPWEEKKDEGQIV